MLEEVLAESANLLDSGLVITFGIEQNAEVIAHHVSLAVTGREMAVGRARLARRVVRTAALHFLVATATLPTFLQSIHLSQLKARHARKPTPTSSAARSMRGHSALSRITPRAHTALAAQKTRCTVKAKRTLAPWPRQNAQGLPLAATKRITRQAPEPFATSIHFARKRGAKRDY